MQRIAAIFVLFATINLAVHFTAAPAGAETPVIGFISEDTTWTQANSPYVTLGNIIVKESVTLTIEPGVTIEFDSGHNLTIEGTLIAKGTDNQTIKFTPKENEYSGAWGGIVFEDSSIDATFDDAGNYISGSILQYCTEEFAGTAVNAVSASPFIDHCVISDSAWRGISIAGGDIVVIQDSMIADNNGSGVSVVDSRDVTLIGNTVSGNTISGVQAYGGGVYISGVGIAAIRGNILRENTARSDSEKGAGGGIYVSVNGIADIKNNTLTGNRVTSDKYDYEYGYGGGIYVEGVTVTISGNVLTENTAEGGFYGHGGGIYLSASDTAIINDNTLIGNRAIRYGHGGGIYVEGVTVTISGNVLTENAAVGSDSHGGGIYLSASDTAIINNNTLTGNRATTGYRATDWTYAGGSTYGGGICMSIGGTATIGDNAFTSNVAIGGDGNRAHGGSGYGGGTWIYAEGDVTISNNTLTENTAGGGRGDGEFGGSGKGGGMYIIIGGTSVISNNTWIGNKATGGYGASGYPGFVLSHGSGGSSYGGGIYVEGNPTVSHNVLTGNTATGGDSERASGGGSYGGGICIYVKDNAAVNNNTLIGNKVKSGYSENGYRYADGGGIHAEGGTVIINYNTLTGNTAEHRGGGIYVEGSPTINNNTISGNHISGSYGAAIHYSGSQEIVGNLITDNAAEEDTNTNAIYISGNPTFTGNAVIDNQTQFNLYYSEWAGSPNLNATNNYWGLTTEAEIRVKIYDFFADNSKAFVDVIPFLLENPLSLGSLTIVVSPKSLPESLPADGSSTATIAATLKDSKGDPVVDEPLTMVISQGTGKLSAVKNNGDGTYTATYTASRTMGTEVILVAAPNSRLAESVEIQLTEPGVILPRILSVPDTVARAGQTVDIPVEIDDITGVAKAGMWLTYGPSFLEVQKVNSTDLIRGLALTTNTDVAGVLTISLEGAKGLTGGSGTMFQVTLKIAKDAPVGETEIKLESTALYDEVGVEIPSTAANGKLMVKEYQPSFTLSLAPGLNLISLPVKPDAPYTARTFAEKLESSLVIRYDAYLQEFLPFVPDGSKTDGFTIEGGQGYIVNVLEEKQVTFSGTVWTNAAPASPVRMASKENAVWAFAVAGFLSTEPRLEKSFSELIVTVRNQRTGQLSQCALRGDTEEFAVAFVDMSRKSVVRAGDMLEITVANSRGELVSVPIVREVSKIDLAKAMVVANLRLGEVIPSQSQLFQNYPNPFNPETWIPFQLAESAEVTIRVYSIAGQLVRTLDLGQKTAGRYLDKTRAAYWDGRNQLHERVSSAVYFYSIEAGDFRATKKLVIAE